MCSEGSLQRIQRHRGEAEVVLIAGYNRRFSRPDMWKQCALLLFWEVVLLVPRSGAALAGP